MSEPDIHRPARALDDLRRSDGSPDVQARKKALDEIAASLSHNEIHNLRSRLNAISFSKDIYLDLPTEILLQVGKYFDLEDIITASHVCRAWLAKFRSPDFSMSIVKRFFRTHWEQADKRDPITKERLANWLPRAAITRLRKQHDKYLSMSAYHHPKIGILLPNDYDELEPQYSWGRIAYKFRESIVVQCLNQGHLAKPKVYTEENRTPIRKWILSNDFLIVQGLGRLNLLAWSLTSHDLHRIRTPSIPKYVSAHCNQVGIITTSNEILVWRVGGSLTKAEPPEIPGSPSSSWSPVAMIFHPLDEQHFFIFYADEKEETNLVQEFIEGRYCRTYQDSPGRLLQESLIDLKIIRVINNDGLCSIGWKVCSDRPPYVKSFDMYTGKFGTMAHPLPDLQSSSMKESLEKYSRLGLKRNTGITQVPIWRVGNSGDPLSDDNFTVVFGVYGYVVWCFDENIKLPRTGSYQPSPLGAAEEVAHHAHSLD